MARPELLSIVIPCYRSAGYIEKTVDELCAALEGWCPFEVVLVNDGSPDHVQELIDALIKKDERIHFVELGANRGQHYATLRGFGVTKGDVVVTVDDDGQNPPSAVKTVAEALASGPHDVVYGRFETTAQTGFRKLASRTNRWMSKHTLGNVQQLSITNVRAIRGELARAVSRAMSSTPYIDALLWRSTRRLGEVQVEHRPREAGQSTYNLWKLIKLWISHLTLLTVLPLQVASAGSIVVSVVGFLLGVVQLVRALLTGGAPAGWLSLFLVTCFLFSMLFAFLAVVSTYVGRVYVELNARGIDWVRSTSGDKRGTGS